MAARLNEWLYKLCSILSSMEMVPNGVTWHTTGTILCDDHEHDDMLYLGEDFTAAPPVVVCLLILLQEADTDERLSQGPHFLVPREGH